MVPQLRSSEDQSSQLKRRVSLVPPLTLTPNPNPLDVLLLFASVMVFVT